MAPVVPAVERHVGEQAVKVRATNRKGAMQVTQRAKPFPNGSSGIQEVILIVE